MKAAKLNQRPAFALMKQTDIQSVHHLKCRDGYFPTHGTRK